MQNLSLQLNSSFCTFSGAEAVDVVYQDVAYNFILDVGETQDDISSINIYINNKCLDVEYISDEVPSRILCRYGKCAFNMIYGITEIVVHIEYINAEEKYLFSGHLAVAIKQQYQKTMDSIQEMLDDIYKKDHALLYQGKIRNAPSFPKSLRNQNSKYEEEIATLKSIIRIYKENLPYFMQNPQCKSSSDYCIDTIEKLRKIESKNLSFIATHPEELKRAYSASGIFVGGHQLMPEKTLVEVNKYSFNLVENQSIVSFINTLLHHVDDKRLHIQKLLDSETVLVKLNQSIKTNYMLSTIIIQQYTKIAFQSYLDSLNEIYSQLSALFMQYKIALPCAASTLRHTPAPTPIFLEINHYRNAFSAMNAWFSFGDFEVPTENVLIHFSSADTIYEYYCLLKIYDVLCLIGFTEKIELREAYKYDVSHPNFTNTSVDNTYYFSNGNTDLVLYYQPVIYSTENEKNNGISLFRTDGKYYTPDFILKKVNHGEITYGILDAKWRNRSVLRSFTEGGLSDLAYKYIYSVVDSNSLLSVPFFWLLQGKDDFILQRTYYHMNGAISRLQSNSFRFSSGIVRLTPNSGVEEFTKILRAFIVS